MTKMIIMQSYVEIREELYCTVLNKRSKMTNPMIILRFNLGFFH